MPIPLPIPIQGSYVTIVEDSSSRVEISNSQRKKKENGRQERRKKRHNTFAGWGFRGMNGLLKGGKVVSGKIKKKHPAALPPQKLVSADGECRQGKKSSATLNYLGRCRRCKSRDIARVLGWCTRAKEVGIAIGCHGS